ALFLGHLATLLAGLREADGNGLLATLDLLAGLAAVLLAPLGLVQCLFDFALCCRAVFRHCCTPWTSRGLAWDEKPAACFAKIVPSIARRPPHGITCAVLGAQNLHATSARR